ncbi:MAG TPA: radical SAM protein [Candidatus Pacearchaeota archaeon]|nr:radical SAM protein [Candidatus Pacearchaeota archaeon]
MKIKFIYPKFDKFLETYSELAEMPSIAAMWAFTMPPALGIPIMVNLTPSEIEWSIQDQNVEEIDFEDDSDLIAISYFTPQASYAYKIGDEFIERGKTVISGGMHPSMFPKEALFHSHSICIGEVETLWSAILTDFKNGQLKSVYKNEKPPAPNEICAPKANVFNHEKYDWHASIVSVTRGCPYNCNWCNIPIYQGKKIRFRPLDILSEEIRQLPGKEFYIADDTIMLNREEITNYLMELCKCIKDYDLSMFLSCSPAMNSDSTFLRSLADAGTKNLYMVFASDAISQMFYTGNKAVFEKCVDLVKKIEDNGIRFFGSFSVGFDFADENQFDLILEFCEKAGVKTAEFFIATPFPNTPFWHEMKEKKRLILPLRWEKYNGANVVFKPIAITENKLLEGFLSLWKDFYRNVNYNNVLSTFPSLYRKASNIIDDKKYSKK